MGEIVFQFSSSFSEGDLATCFTQFKTVSLFFIRENRLETLKPTYFFLHQQATSLLQWPPASSSILQLARAASLSDLSTISLGKYIMKRIKSECTARLKALEIRASCKERLCIRLMLRPMLLWIPLQLCRLSRNNSQVGKKPFPLRSHHAWLDLPPSLSALISHFTVCLAPSGAAPPSLLISTSSQLFRLARESLEEHLTRWGAAT